MTIKNKKDFLIINYQKSIKFVMSQMSKRGEQYAILTDNKNKLKGLVTDGDLRRALVKKINIESKISDIMNKKPKSINLGELDINSYTKLNRKVKYLPIIDQYKNVTGILTSVEKSISNNILDKKICVIGLGFVGLTLSLVMSDCGFKVYGYDNNKVIVNNLNKSKPQFYEKGLINHLKKSLNKNLEFYNSIKKISADVYIITVGTPLSRSSNKPDISAIKEVSINLSKILKKGDLIILRSTVPIGTSRNIVKKIIEDNSKLICGLDYFLSYAPERTVEGDAINEIKTLPQIIGGYDKKSTNMSDNIFSEFASNIIKVENLESAEMIKIMNNTFRDVKFAYANEIAIISKKLGLNVIDLIKAANKGYPRDQIALPSPGVGGPCLPKDTKILEYSIKNLKRKSKLISTARKVNISIIPEIYSDIISYLIKIEKKINKCKFFIMGIAFKGSPETSDYRGSSSLDLINLFIKNYSNKKNIYVYDPVIDKKSIKKIGLNFTSISNGFKNADVILVMNNHQLFQKLEINKLLKKSKKQCLFFDGWNLFDLGQIEQIRNSKYIGVGVNK